MTQDREIKVGYLARVEGEGRLYIKTQGNKVEAARLEIFEPPRFFEAFLRGRHFSEVPDITARICGICPVAYQMSSVHAIEDALGVKVEGALRDLRRLLYCGEWIESHTLHLAMLHAPDFLGYESAVHMAKDHPDIVKKALRLKKAGNAIVQIVGGREIHPINVRVGGFHRAPTKAEVESLVPELEWSRETAYELVRWTAGLSFPELSRPYTFVSLSHPDEYPMNEGRLATSLGTSLAVQDYPRHFEEIHVPHSNALQAAMDDGQGGKTSYFVGPMARFALNRDKLSPLCLKACAEAGAAAAPDNPFKSIVIRAIEILYACDEALRLIRGYKPPAKSCIETPPREGVGHGCTEAPRGILYHRYALEADGRVKQAVIIPPTSQNQRTIEEDLAQFVESRLDWPDDKLTWQCEQAVRNYDPCISCATHFLRLTVERE